MDESTFSKFSLFDCQISPLTGFLPSTPPLSRLPGQYFAAWEELVFKLPELIKNKQLRREVNKLAELEFNSTTLQSDEEWNRAYTMLCFLGHSYIWMEGQKGIVDKVPQNIAIPWCAVSDHLHLKPVVSYCSTGLFNYVLRDPHGPWNEDNIYANTTFTGTEDESWFYIIPLVMELAAVPTLRAIEVMLQNMSCQKDIIVQKCLETAQESLREMRMHMKKMTERCNPVMFYVHIRTFLAGSKGLDIFPRGIIYEGVSLEPKQFHGASAGQSSIVHVFDILLGAKHFGAEKEFLDAMLQYMPVGHRRFLELLKEMPSVRDYCKKSGNACLITSYNRSVQELTQFRSDHVILVAHYIVNQQCHSQNPTLDKKGSGGTNFMKFLKKVRNDTADLLIKL